MNVAVARVVCADRPKHCATTGRGECGFVLKNVKRIEPIPYKGQLNFWNYEGTYKLI